VASASSVCGLGSCTPRSPSRAGLLTGRYQQRHGWEFNPARRDVDSGMSLDERTIADVLKADGYATGMIGKWHLGYQDGHHPLARGFEEYFGVLAGASSYIDPATPGAESIMGPYPPTRRAQFGVYRGRELVEVQDYLTDVFTEEAVAFIDRHRDEPFFLYLSHTTPHSPLQATAKYLDRYRHIEDKGTRIYAAMVASLDNSVGAVVEKLDAIGQLENTLIVFASDNGCFRSRSPICSNAPYAGFKRYHQEGGIRVPLIMSWPGELPAGTVYERPIISLDLLATFSAAAGQSTTTEDSVNLLPYLTGAMDGAPHEYLYWRAGPTIAIRDEHWKLIRYNGSPLSKADLRADGRLEPPPGGWGTDSPNGQLTLLYDLSNDPGETENLAAEHPSIVARLEKAHADWATGLTDTPILPALRSTLVDLHGDTVQLISDRCRSSSRA
jgi:arylsulfatase A-like enzyme